MHKLLTATGAVFALAACATVVPPAPDGLTAGAEIRDSAGRVVATAMAAEREGSVSIRVEAAGLAPGTYGVHVHAVGRCDAPGFTTAGPHWNPEGRQHGRDNPQGMHKGDLPNLVVGVDGRGRLDQAMPMATLSGGAANALLDADGAAIVVHAQSDDYRTDPSGNSGARIACGVLARP